MPIASIARNLKCIFPRTGASATTSVAFLFAAIPMLFIYKQFGHFNLLLNVALLLATGFLVGYAPKCRPTRHLDGIKLSM